MHKYHPTVRRGFLALLALSVGLSSWAHAQSYTVSDLGTLPGKKMSSPAALNNQGQVAGTSFDSEENQSAFIHYGLKGMEDLGQSAPDSVNRAFGINSSGWVVGDSTFGGTAFGPSEFSHAALFANGTSYDLGSLTPGEYSRANGINVNGHVVGASGPKPGGKSGRAFFWSEQIRMIDLGTLGGEHAEALAINDSGYITGHAVTANLEINGPHAFLTYANANGKPEMKDLGTLGGESSYGTAINVNNHVAGYSSTLDNRIHAFLHDGAMIDLGSLGGKAAESDQSFALGVNAADQVVGYTYLPADRLLYGQPDGAITQPQPVAFLYQNGKMTDLNELIGSAANTYRLYSATAINDQGQIVANALEYESGLFRAVLLTPVPVDPPYRSRRAPVKR